MALLKSNHESWVTGAAAAPGLSTDCDRLLSLVVLCTISGRLIREGDEIDADRLGEAGPVPVRFF